MSGFRRDSYNGNIAGVCEGLGNYFNISPRLVRLAAVIGGLFSFGTTILIYLVLWIIMPNQRY